MVKLDNTEETYISYSDDIAWREVEGSAIILNLKTGYYYTLDKVGLFVWRLLRGQRGLSEIANEISEEYGIDIDQAKQDLGSLVRELQEEHLIRSSTEQSK